MLHARLMEIRLNALSATSSWEFRENAMQKAEAKVSCWQCFF